MRFKTYCVVDNLRDENDIFCDDENDIFIMEEKA